MSRPSGVPFWIPAQRLNITPRVAGSRRKKRAHWPDRWRHGAGHGPRRRGPPTNGTELLLGSTIGPLFAVEREVLEDSVPSLLLVEPRATEVARREPCHGGDTRVFQPRRGLGGLVCHASGSADKVARIRSAEGCRMGTTRWGLIAESRPSPLSGTNNAPSYCTRRYHACPLPFERNPSCNGKPSRHSSSCPQASVGTPPCQLRSRIGLPSRKSSRERGRAKSPARPSRRAQQDTNDG